MEQRNFACPHAYLTTETGKNRVVLCDGAGKPDFEQYKSIVNCMCAYQPPCPEKHICALAKGWEGCWRLLQERRAAEKEKASEKAKKATRRSRKSK